MAGVQHWVAMGTEFRFPPIAFYLLDIVIHLMLPLLGVGRRGAPESLACFGKLGRPGRPAQPRLAKR